MQRRSKHELSGILWAISALAKKALELYANELPEPLAAEIERLRQHAGQLSAALAGLHEKD